MKVESFAVGDLVPYYKNPRRGNVDLVAESLRVNGQFKPIVVNLGTKTGRELEVLAGNHTLHAARKLGWDSIEAVVLDLSEEEAARVVLADNRASDDSEYDNESLKHILDGLVEVDELLGSLWSQEEYENIELLGTNEWEWANEPNPSLEDKKEREASKTLSVILTFADVEALKDFNKKSGLGIDTKTTQVEWVVRDGE